jgi:beta-lactam-binding protein with PASTA domain
MLEGARNEWVADYARPASEWRAVVLSQSPVAGTTVRRGTIVHLVVGDGLQD